MAPGGFGKTTLLAEACRRAVDRGVPVAWVTLAAEDGAAALDAAIAFAFQAASLDLLARLPAAGAALGDAHPRTALRAAGHFSCHHIQGQPHHTVPFRLVERRSTQTGEPLVVLHGNCSFANDSHEQAPVSAGDIGPLREWAVFRPVLHTPDLSGCLLHATVEPWPRRQIGLKAAAA